MRSTLNSKWCCTSMSLSGTPTSGTCHATTTFRQRKIPPYGPKRITKRRCQTTNSKNDKHSTKKHAPHKPSKAQNNNAFNSVV